MHSILSSHFSNRAKGGGGGGVGVVLQVGDGQNSALPRFLSISGTAWTSVERDFEMHAGQTLMLCANQHSEHLMCDTSSILRSTEASTTHRRCPACSAFSFKRDGHHAVVYILACHLFAS